MSVPLGNIACQRVLIARQEASVRLSAIYLEVSRRRRREGETGQGAIAATFERLASLTHVDEEAELAALRDRHRPRDDGRPRSPQARR